MAYEMMILLKCIFFGGGDSCWALNYFFCFGIAFLLLVCGSVCVPLQGCCRCLLCVLLCDFSLPLLCVDVLLVCAEGYTQVTGVMAMMMTGRVLLVCALCVLWCGAGGGYAWPYKECKSDDKSCLNHGQHKSVYNSSIRSWFLGETDSTST
ncbi:putative mucin-associated surface protein (MASP), partial [Trypanosoma cruzi]